MASRGNGRKHIAEYQKERRRALQARHRATLSGLFDSLRHVVCPSLEKTPAKGQILHHAKIFLQKQEACLKRLLSFKEMLDDDGPCSLKEVRAEYRRLYCQRSWKPGWRVGVPVAIDDSESSSEDDPTDDPGLSQSTPVSVPNILEFEGYLIFYRQTVERLLGGRVLSLEQTSLPVVSEAISGLWESLAPERRTAFWEQGSFAWAISSNAPPLPDTPGWSSQTNSQGASGSSFEEDLLQDAYDVVQRELDLTSADSPALDSQELTEIYRDIMCFVKTQMMEEAELTKPLPLLLLSQDLCLAADYEAGFLRCTETFDDDDL
ncbi:hypothetical protein AAFF_G00173680 [Aldrovandia affinis]|uniref:STRA8 bHLH domain-containing protein n=1 Tax=Aldrovandia affinis TaxID=143900 RepID=A0AAD7SYY7_9TELE|nr:hypothetical protein AAFF_G00173680 [Aldrovandia affinis]